MSTPNTAMELRRFAAAGMLLCALDIMLPARAKQPVEVSVDWDKTIALSKTTPTMLVINHPLLRQDHALHDVLLAAIKSLDANYVRYMVYDPYPRLSVAELEPPTKGKTSWNFSLIDPEMIGFLEATKGHEPIVNFSTIPAWMFKRDKPVHYPDNPDQMETQIAQVIWNDRQGVELIDPTGKQVGEYYARIVSWYTQGGFTDENGKYHHSGYHYDLPWWGVLNEPEWGHITPEQYTLLYDAIVSAIHKVSPKTRFVGLALAPIGVAWPSPQPDFFQRFLNPKNHRPGIPLDMISYHFYAVPTVTQTIDSWQYTFFDQADGFLNSVRLIESIRKRLSPSTRVDLDELGVILPEDFKFVAPSEASAIPPAYWNLSGALYAYLYEELAKEGIDVATASQFIGFPPSPGTKQIGNGMPSIPLVDWTTGKPNARFRVLELLEDNFGPGDKLVSTKFDSVFGAPSDWAMQAFVSAKGKKLLVINKRAHAIDVRVAAVGRVSRVDIVDESTAGNPPRSEILGGESLHLEAFAVAVLTIEN